MSSKYLIHKNNVLKVIYQNENISRKKLHDLLDLRFATITNITKELIEERLIEEIGREKSINKGRPHTLLRIVPNSRFFIGCELEPEKILSLILNFKGEIISKEEVDFGKDIGKEEILNEIVNLIKKMVAKSKIEKNRIFGIGFVDPGIIDIEKGVSIFSTILPQWKNVNTKQYIEEKIGIETFIIGTSQAKVLSERFFGEGKEKDDFIFIEFGEGIGCGIMSKGRIVHGIGGVAGEFGHIQFPERTEVCNCGKKGCLEAIVSIPSIEKKIKEIVGKDLKIKEIKEEFDKGDEKIKEILKEVFELFSISISNLINLLNPGLVILDKNFLFFKNLLNEFLIENIKKHMVYQYDIKFEISKFGEEIGAIGGACLSMSKFLKLDI
ncbi:MAG: ROK family protein [Candidatus Omnitrophica bacterium]|nr:ROK family protein [Candidatus Omnitrophota bacterium]